MKYLKQPYRSKKCGQTCLAMILNKSIDEVCKMLNNKYRSTCIYKDLAVCLELNGYKVTKHYKRGLKQEEIPNNSVIRVQFPNKNGHFIVKVDNEYYDPSVGIVKYLNEDRLITHYINYEKQ